jgi:hypothetical protein
MRSTRLYKIAVLHPCSLCAPTGYSLPLSGQEILSVLGNARLNSDPGATAVLTEDFPWIYLFLAGMHRDGISIKPLYRRSYISSSPARRFDVTTK